MACRALKSFSARRINRLRRSPGTSFWQRGFYDHIIRHHRETDAIRQYIANNPLKWEADRDNPSNIGISQGR
jgi:REP element-mobilizing transposase RayT